MAVPDDETGFLLKWTDDAVSTVQSLVTLLSSYYESAINSDVGASNMMVGALNTESLEDLYRLVNELLAKLWPCEKRFVAVIGPTGCGKSTLLNLLTSMTCKTGDDYLQGLKLDESRAVLRDTVLEHRGGPKMDVDQDRDSVEGDSQEEPSSASMGSLPEDSAFLHTPNLEKEQEAMCGLLGICCAKDRAAYLGEHLALYDRYPFILQNGRMGDAGTTKVTAVQWGPKFVARIQWVHKRKLRKRWRELRSLLERPELLDPSERDTPLDSTVVMLKENKELWQSMLKIVEHPLDSEHLPTPTEELIEATLKKLSRKVALGKKEFIEKVPSQGCVVDRLYVRDGIRKRLTEEKLGMLLEDLVIEAPIPSSEGGVSLLDVPGTNDPRLLHQRETRDAIDRTSLILLILDRSVLDAGTQKVLEDSPVLERMLLDSSQRCNLVVVGIAEKRCTSSQPASDIVTQFDPTEALKKALKSVFLKKVRNLVKARRLNDAEAKMRLQSIFKDNRFRVLPVLPLLCASLHLSASNPVIHRKYCESPGAPTCPAVMNAEERMKMCLQTNIPQLLEMIQSVRVPSSRVNLKSYLESALSTLKMYTQESTYDESMVKFFDRELKRGQHMAKNPIAVETLVPDNSIDLDYIRDKLSSYSQQCILSTEDQKYLRQMIQGPDSLKVTNNSVNQDLPPVLMRGFRPEVIGAISRELMESTEGKSSSFVNAVYLSMVTQMNGEEAWRDYHLDQVSVECLGACVALLQDVKTQWKHTLERTLARCTCGGSDGGLQKHVRGALRKAYDTTFKTALVEMRKQRAKKASTDELVAFLERFAFGEKVKDAAFAEIEKCLYFFWDTLITGITMIVSKLRSDWIRQLQRLRKSTKAAPEAETHLSRSTVSDMPVHQSLRISLQARVSELEHLLERLQSRTPSLGDAEVNYGYSLLQSNPSYENELLHVAVHVASEQKPTLVMEDSNQVEPSVQFKLEATSTPRNSLKLEVGTGASDVNVTTPMTSGVNVTTMLNPRTSAGGSLASSKSKLGGPKRLPSRGVITLPEHEAHNLHMANHEQRGDKRRRT